jgi:hypothetical protein
LFPHRAPLPRQRPYSHSDVGGLVSLRLCSCTNCQAWYQDVREPDRSPAQWWSRPPPTLVGVGSGSFPCTVGTTFGVGNGFAVGSGFGFIVGSGFGVGTGFAVGSGFGFIVGSGFGVGTGFAVARGFTVARGFAVGIGFAVGRPLTVGSALAVASGFAPGSALTVGTIVDLICGAPGRTIVGIDTGFVAGTVTVGTLLPVPVIPPSFPARAVAVATAPCAVEPACVEVPDRLPVEEPPGTCTTPVAVPTAPPTLPLVFLVVPLTEPPGRDVEPVDPVEPVAPPLPPARVPPLPCPDVPVRAPGAWRVPWAEPEPPGA